MEFFGTNRFANIELSWKKVELVFVRVIALKKAIAFGLLFLLERFLNWVQWNQTYTTVIRSSSAMKPFENHFCHVTRKKRAKLHAPVKSWLFFLFSVIKKPAEDFKSKEILHGIFTKRRTGRFCLY